MVERVRIEPTRILLKDASSNIKFDTNNYYLRTDPQGTLKVGGYTAAPTVYGQNSIYDHGNGGFTSSIFGGGTPGGTVSATWVIDIPESTSTRLVYGNGWTANPPPLTGGFTPFKSSIRPLIFYAYNPDGSITSTNIGGYYWKSEYFNIDSEYAMQGAYIQFVNIYNQDISRLPQVNSSGYFVFKFDQVDAKNWTRTYTYTGEYGAVFTANDKYSNIIGGNLNEYGAETWYPGNAVIMPMMLLSETTPTTLSIGRTA